MVRKKIDINLEQKYDKHMSMKVAAMIFQITVDRIATFSVFSFGKLLLNSKKKIWLLKFHLQVFLAIGERHIE